MSRRWPRRDLGGALRAIPGVERATHASRTPKGHLNTGACGIAYHIQMQSNERNGISRWWRVAGGLSMNLALGTLYAWSVFVAPLEKQFGWKRADTSMVFTIAVMVFALTF